MRVVLSCIVLAYVMLYALIYSVEVYDSRVLCCVVCRRVASYVGASLLVVISSLVGGVVLYNAAQIK